MSGDQLNLDAFDAIAAEGSPLALLVAEVRRLRAQVGRVEKFQKGLVVLGNLPIEKREDGLTGGIEACAALADDLRVTLDGP